MKGEKIGDERRSVWTKVEMYGDKVGQVYGHRWISRRRSLAKLNVMKGYFIGDKTRKDWDILFDIQKDLWISVSSIEYNVI